MGPVKSLSAAAMVSVPVPSFEMPVCQVMLPAPPSVKSFVAASTVMEAGATATPAGISTVVVTPSVSSKVTWSMS